MKYLLAVMILPFFALSGHAQNLYDFENSAAFASYLRQTNQFELAIPEYERLVFMKPGKRLIGCLLGGGYVGSRDKPSVEPIP